MLATKISTIYIEIREKILKKFEIYVRIINRDRFA